MTTPSLSAAVRELLAALAGRDAEAAGAWCSDEARRRGEVPLDALCDAATPIRAAPRALERGSRAIVRLVTSDEPLWLLWEEGADWRCVGTARSRRDAHAFLVRAEPGGWPGFASPARSAAIEPGLHERVLALVEALEVLDAETARALVGEPRGEGAAGSLADLFRRVADAPSDVEVGEWRVSGDRAAVRLLLHDRDATTAVWSTWRRRGAEWVLLAAPAAWEPAGLFVGGHTDSVPAWEALGTDREASRWAEALIEAARTGGRADLPPTVLDRLGDRHELRVGEVVALAGAHRAMVRVDAVDPADDFAVGAAWIVLDRDVASGPWRFRAAAEGGTLEALLEGVEVPWSPTEAAVADANAEADRMVRDALRSALLELFEAARVDPASVALDAMSRAELEALVPRLVGQVFGAVFAGALDEVVRDLSTAEPAQAALLERLFGPARKT